MSKIRIKKNSAGKWINAKTGKFVSKAIYEPVEKARQAANLKRSESLKEYWQAVKSFEKMGYTREKARNYVGKSPKYLEKRNKKAFLWDKFWQNEKGKPREHVKQAKKQLEAEGYELVSY